MLTDMLKSTQSVANPAKATKKVANSRSGATKVAHVSVAPKPQVEERVEVTPVPQPKVVKQQPPVNNQTSYDNLFVQDFSRDLRKVELWFSNPGVGKSTMSRNLCNMWKTNDVIEDYVWVKCHEDMTVQSLFKTTMTDENGNWKFPFNRMFHALTDKMQKRYVIVFDEFNLLPMSVQKGLQNTLDDTIGDFDFEDKVYEKNPNVSFILNINHRDIGVNQLADAIKDRAFPVFFRDLDNDSLALRTQMPVKFLELLKRIYDMFANLGDLQPFHKSVRHLNMLHGLNKQQFKEYLISQLELAGIEWQEVTAISPEFQNALDEFDNVKGGE